MSATAAQYVGDVPAGRTGQGRFAPGVSGNPTGAASEHIRRVRELQRLILDKHGPKVIEALQELLNIGNSGDESGKVRVAALNAFLQHMGSMGGIASAAKRETASGDDDAKLNDEELWTRALSVPGVRETVLKVLQGGKP